RSGVRHSLPPRRPSDLTHPDSTTTLQNVGGTINRVNNLEVTNQYATFTGYHWKKYFDEADLPGEVARSQQNFIVMRYAEVLLTRSEEHTSELLSRIALV